MPRIRNSWLPHWLRGDYTLKNSELLFSAVSRISNALSAMPIQLYQGASPINDDLNDLIGFSPNPNMTSCQFFKTFEACRDTSGNGYALKILDYDGTLSRLDILDPMRVTPILDEDSGELWYRIRPEKGAEYYVHNYYMIHIPFISTNGYSGVNPVSVLYDTLDYSQSIQTFSAKSLEEGVNAKFVLEAPANLGDAQKTEMLSSFIETYKETSGSILLLESGVTAKTLNLSPVDSKLLEVEKITRSKVAMVYNIPPHLLGDYSDASFSSQEQQMLEFLMLTMLPIVTAYEQELNRKLLTKEQRKQGYRFKFDMDNILRADAQTRAEVDYKAVRSAWSTPDEIRASRGKPPLPNGIGGKAVISQDLAPLDYTVNDKPRVLMAKLLGRDKNEGKEGLDG
ncbi:MAG: phage portal protein [Enterococcus lemanii]